jgi:hypothetical protein
LETHLGPSCQSLKERGSGFGCVYSLSGDWNDSWSSSNGNAGHMRCFPTLQIQVNHAWVMLPPLRSARPTATNRLRRLSMCARLNHIAPPAGVKSDNPATDLKAKKRTRRNPARRLSMQATKPTAPPSASIAVTRRGRYTGDYRKFADERPLSRPLYQHPLVRKITSQKVRRVLGRPAFRLLLMRSSEVVDQEHVTKSTERTQQHTKRQELRSQRRMRLLSIRMAWYRQSQEKTSIGDDLWQRAQEEQHSAPRKDDLWAWPRLAQRQRELLADEVEAFVRGRQ